MYLPVTVYLCLMRTRFRYKWPSIFIVSKSCVAVSTNGHKFATADNQEQNLTDSQSAKMKLAHSNSNFNFITSQNVLSTLNIDTDIY